MGRKESNQTNKTMGYLFPSNFCQELCLKSGRGPEILLARPTHFDSDCTATKNETFLAKFYDKTDKFRRLNNLETPQNEM